jgi:S-ribosylhomocysteine lyase LuxS involved in autoinducer biosynthesis
MTAKEKLQEIVDALTAHLEDAAKFDRGMNSPGTRVRSAASEAAKKLKELRALVQETRNSRKENN